MELLETYILLLGIVIIVGMLSKNTVIPNALLLVIAGMLVSFVPYFPRIEIDPWLVLNLFLPVLIYQISISTSWKDIHKHFRAIMLMSVGHVLWITLLVGLVFHTLLPELGWPIAFILGAVVSPPDDVAIVAIAEKIHMPRRVVTILTGEGMLNDATALILFRIALGALLGYHFSMVGTVGTFLGIIIGETCYGIALGFVLGEIRVRISNPILHMMTSLITPFLAYLPAEKMGGSGVLATVMTGFVIGHIYSLRFPPDFRLLSRAVWPTLAFGIEGILFLLIGLDLPFILENISSISFFALMMYSLAIVATVIIGRFLWVYPATYLPRFLFPSIRKKDPYPSWQSTFIVSWAGMRGGISLAAALAIPFIPSQIYGAGTRDFVIFIVFCVITATLIAQGLSLPWLLKRLKIHQYSQKETQDEDLAELKARLHLTETGLTWLTHHQKSVPLENIALLAEIKLKIDSDRIQRQQLLQKIKHHQQSSHSDENNVLTETSHFLSAQILNAQKNALYQLWQEEKISHSTRNKLQDKLDHHSQNLS